MMHLIAAAAFLLATHFGLSSGNIRAAIVGRFGEQAFLGLFSTVALGAFVWLVLAWRAADVVVLWPVFSELWLVPLVVMPFSLLLLVGGVSTLNPTSVGEFDTLGRPDLVRGPLRVTRHPLMWAIGLWAFAHVPPNGELASLLFFGTLGTLALVGTLVQDGKAARRDPERWPAFVAVTSGVPLLAVIQGRQSFGRAVVEYGSRRALVAAGVYLVLLFLHPWLSGGFSAVPWWG